MLNSKFILCLIISLSLVSCKWEKVDYGKFEDDVPKEYKIKDVKVGDVPTLNIGTKSITLPIEVEGLYKDAKGYRLSDLNKALKVFCNVNGDSELTELNFSVINDNGLKLIIDLPSIVKTSLLSIYVDDKIVAKKTIEIGGVSLSIDQQYGNADSWIDHANIRFNIDASDEALPVISPRLIATVSEDNSAEERVIKINPLLKQQIINVDNLKPSTTYDVELKLDGTDQKVAYRFSTESIESIPNSSFETWTQYKRSGAYWELEFPYDEANPGDSHWDTYNKLTCRYGLDNNQTNLRYRANSSTIPTNDAHTGEKAALVRTVGYGKSATSAGGWSINIDIGIGSLYLGSFNDQILSDAKSLPNLGIPFHSRPKTFSFWAKYKPVDKNDKFYAEIVLLAKDGTKVAEGILDDSLSGMTKDNEYHQYTVDITYNTQNVKPEKMYIRFLSGRNNSDKTSNIIYGSTTYYSEHVGAQLYLDDISVAY